MRNVGRIAWATAAAIAAGIGCAYLVDVGRPAPDPGAPGRPEASRPAPPALAGLGRAPPTASPTSTPKAGPSPEEVTRDADGVEPSVPSASPSVAVTLRLRRSDGRPVERASVRCGDDGAPLPWDPQTGTVRLPKGRQSVEILGGRFGEWRQPEDFEIDVRAGMSPVEVTLRPWRMIVGRLTATGEGVTVRAAARLDRLDSDGRKTPDWTEDCRVDLAPPDDGWFCFGQTGELEPGTYTVSAAPWYNGPVRASRDVVVRDEAVFVELGFPRADASDGVVLTVLDPSGHPHEPSMVVQDVRDKDGGGSSGPATMAALGDGRYWIPLVFPAYAGGEATDVTLWVRSATYGERRVDVRAERRPPPIVVRFEPAADLRLQVENRHEWLAQGGMIEAWIPVRNGTRHVARGPLAADGTATIAALQPGEVHLSVAGQGPSGWMMRLALGRVSLHVGRNDVTVAAPPLHPLRVRGVGDAWLVLRATDGNGTWGTFPRWSSEDLLRLPAGAYEFRSGGRTATVDVPGASEVTLPEPAPK